MKKVKQNVTTLPFQSVDGLVESQTRLPYNKDAAALFSHFLATSLQQPQAMEEEEEPSLNLENGISQDSRPSLVDKMVLSIDETAYVLGVSKPMVYELTKLNDFPCFRIGKRLVVGKDALQRWVDGQCHREEKEDP